MAPIKLSTWSAEATEVINRMNVIPAKAGIQLDPRLRRADRPVPSDQAPDRRLYKRRGGDINVKLLRSVLENKNFIKEGYEYRRRDKDAFRFEF